LKTVDIDLVVDDGNVGVVVGGVVGGDGDGGGGKCLLEKLRKSGILCQGVLGPLCGKRAPGNDCLGKVEGYLDTGLNCGNGGEVGDCIFLWSGWPRPGCRGGRSSSPWTEKGVST